MVGVGVLAIAGAAALWASRRTAAGASARQAQLEGELAVQAERTLLLESEMQARTATLEDRNRALGEALEKLRRAQDDIIRNEKLASMGRLVAGIAHEVNNPMN